MLGTAAGSSSGVFDAHQFIASDLAQLQSAAPDHIVPITSNTGFELKQHRLIAKQRVDRLHNVDMPEQWMTPPRFSTRTELRAARANEMRPDKSFDVDGDGFVGQQDYAISRKHDLGGQGMLTGGQRDSAIAETCYRMGSQLHDDEIGGNARARRIMASLRNEPELVDTARREGRLRMAGMAVSSLKMKSSHQLQDCLRFPERTLPPELNGPVYTRTMLLQRRRNENAAMEESGRQNFLRMTGATSW